YAISTISADHATAAFTRVDRPEIEVLVVPGGNFPTMRAIAAWEQQFQKPVVTTNQAALWAMMGVMQIATPLPGLGRLLAQMTGVEGAYRREQREAGEDAAAGLSSTARSMAGSQRVKAMPNAPSRVWSNPGAPRVMSHRFSRVKTGGGAAHRCALFAPSVRT